MKVLIVSQCTKNALCETRRILDQFAERCGDRVWSTRITMQGLDTLKRMLKRTARRNTSVACHWMHGKRNDELIWIVGNPNRFNEEGCVPTNRTGRNVLRQEGEDGWHTREDIQILAAIAALFHDFGKASLTFQQKLIKGAAKSDAYRHEWISLAIFKEFIGGQTDEAWLKELANFDSTVEKNWWRRAKELEKVDKSNDSSKELLDGMSPLAQTVGWLILSHHRLPTKKDVSEKCWQKILSMMNYYWNDAKTEASEKEKKDCWKFPEKLLFLSKSWQSYAKYWAIRALRHPHFLNQSWIQTDPYSIHLARLALMLADHYYSSEPCHPYLGDKDYPLYANTERSTRQLKQRLDEHLVGVTKHAARISSVLPSLLATLPTIASLKEFKRRSKIPFYQWQDRAFDLAQSIQSKTDHQGFFGVNMASTGSGKTLANGRIMYGLASSAKGARFTIALGLRTLTLQTGEAYRRRLHLSPEELAVLVGSSAVKQLFEMEATDESDSNKENLFRSGSESEEKLFLDNEYVHFDGSIENNLIQRWFSKQSDTALLHNSPYNIEDINIFLNAK